MTSRHSMFVTGGSVSLVFLSPKRMLRLDLVKHIMLAHFLLSLPMAVFSYPIGHNVFLFLKVEGKTYAWVGPSQQDSIFGKVCIFLGVVYILFPESNNLTEDIGQHYI